MESSSTEAIIHEELRAKIEALGAEVPIKIPIPVIPPVSQSRKVVDRDSAEWKQLQREKEWTALVDDRGERYRDCRLNNFAVSSPVQTQAIEKLRRYCENIRDYIRDGHGIVLFGPRGTGKDHLAMAICRAAIMSGFRVRWENGMDLFGEIRDSFDGVRGTSEKEFVRRMASPDLLYLSDPLPPYGDLSPFQASMLFRILDARYSRKKPVVCTINATGSQEMDARMGSQNVDRLRDGTVAIFCNWETNRRTMDL